MYDKDNENILPPPDRSKPTTKRTLFGAPGPVRLDSASTTPSTLGKIISRPPPPMKRKEEYFEQAEDTVDTVVTEYEAIPVEAEYTRPESPVTRPSQPVDPEPVMRDERPAYDSDPYKRQSRWESNASPATSWSSKVTEPEISDSSFVHPLGMVAGNVIISKNVYIAGGAMVRGDNDEPICVGEESAILEGAVLKDLPTRKKGEQITQRIVDVGNRKYSLYIGRRASICAQAQVHGPAYIADGVYVGMQSLIFWARIEKNVIVEPGCLIMNVTIPSGVFVPSGLKVTTQRMVKDLPPLSTKYRFHGINEETVTASLELLKGYKSLIVR